MSSYPYFKRRIYGPRCATPPTYVCYELPQPDPYSRSSSSTSSDEGSGDEDSGSESASNVDEDGNRSPGSSDAPVESMQIKSAPSGDNWEVVDTGIAEQPTVVSSTGAKDSKAPLEPQDIPCPPSGNEEDSEDASERLRLEKREGKKKEVVVPDATDDTTVTAPMDVDVKVEHESPSKRRTKKKSRRRRAEDRAPAYRPILTIRSSQGFVWNQDLFVPSYIKERYIASSPPSSFAPMGSGSPGSKHLVNNNFFSSSNEMDYEVECVEIHVDEDDLDSIIPRA
ncbi:hypothetical protein FRB94_008979 [Tulasnella sp. JGI-2019a]|nr:hypothetical protein FRB93_003491 [Tulasnella sp. JGI-2019a]KAG9014821.1 hypothetical protein FRB94_008979 [Tulasnella sp. JGI-2019a]KAG9040018.1 hypothetical protein FRB95_004490 [Tulasnella sp. JGI-2019a]